MDNTGYTIVVDTPQPGQLTLELLDGLGATVDTQTLAYQGPVDNLLLTAVDNLVQKHTLQKSVLARVKAGPGIDKNSSLYRIVISVAQAIAVSQKSQS